MAGGVDKFMRAGIHSCLEPIAIIGMACVFPQAPDVAAFWRNILTGVDAIDEPPPAWDAPRYVESGRIKTPYGGYLKDLYRFDPREFGIMPSSLDGANRISSLRCGSRAMRYRMPDTCEGTTTTAIPASSSATARICTGARALSYRITSSWIKLLSCCARLVPFSTTPGSVKSESCWRANCHHQAQTSRPVWCLTS